MSQDVTVEREGVTMNLGPVESVKAGQAGGVLVRTARGTVVTLPLWAIEGIDRLARCAVCQRIAPPADDECPDCGH